MFHVSSGKVKSGSFFVESSFAALNSFSLSQLSDRHQLQILLLRMFAGKRNAVDDALRKIQMEKFSIFVRNLTMTGTQMKSSKSFCIEFTFPFSFLMLPS